MPEANAVDEHLTDEDNSGIHFDRVALPPQDDPNNIYANAVIPESRHVIDKHLPEVDHRSRLQSKKKYRTDGKIKKEQKKANSAAIRARDTLNSRNDKLAKRLKEPKNSSEQTSREGFVSQAEFNQLQTSYQQLQSSYQQLHSSYEQSKLGNQQLHSSLQQALQVIQSLTQLMDNRPPPMYVQTPYRCINGSVVNVYQQGTPPPTNQR